MVIARKRYDGTCEVASVLVTGLGSWRRPLPNAFHDFDAALAAGESFALTMLDTSPLPKAS